MLARKETGSNYEKSLLRRTSRETAVRTLLKERHSRRVGWVPDVARLETVTQGGSTPRYLTGG